MRNSLPCMRLQKGKTLVTNCMETIAHARKAAHQDDVVVSLKENHALPIAMEGGHAKMKQSILHLEAPQATEHMEKGKMSRGYFFCRLTKQQHKWRREAM